MAKRKKPSHITRTSFDFQKQPLTKTTKTDLRIRARRGHCNKLPPKSVPNK